MEIPVGKTYVAHAIFALYVLVFGTLGLLINLADSGSAQAWAMLGMFVMIPAVLFAAYSVITVIVTLLRRERVPRDMILLPAGFLVGIVGGSAISQLEKPFSTAVSYLLWASYLIMTLTLVARHQMASRRKGSI